MHILSDSVIDNSTQLSIYIVRVYSSRLTRTRQRPILKPAWVCDCSSTTKTSRSIFEQFGSIPQQKLFVIERVIVRFISDLNHTLLNSVELLVCLSVWLYPQDRYLDALRVLWKHALCECYYFCLQAMTSYLLFLEQSSHLAHSPPNLVFVLNDGSSTVQCLRLDEGDGMV